VLRTYAAKHPDTLIVSVSDHATGGITLGGGAILPFDDAVFQATAGAGQTAYPYAAGAHPQVSSDLTANYRLPSLERDYVFPYFFRPIEYENQKMSFPVMAKHIKAELKKNADFDFIDFVQKQVGAGDLGK
jgi:alkaline phosphatase